MLKFLFNESIPFAPWREHQCGIVWNYDDGYNDHNDNDNGDNKNMVIKQEGFEQIPHKYVLIKTAILYVIIHEITMLHTWQTRRRPSIRRQRTLAPQIWRDRWGWQRWIRRIPPQQPLHPLPNFDSSFSLWSTDLNFKKLYMYTLNLTQRSSV